LSSSNDVITDRHMHAVEQVNGFISDSFDTEDDF